MFYTKYEVIDHVESNEPIMLYTSSIPLEIAHLTVKEIKEFLYNDFKRREGDTLEIKLIKGVK